jgi:hypothetical protein
MADNAQKPPALLPVHPLVAGLKAASEGKPPAEASRIALEAPGGEESAQTVSAALKKVPPPAPAKRQLATQQASGPTDTDAFSASGETFVLVAGYLGGGVGPAGDQRTGLVSDPVQVLYLDAGLVNWLLVPLAEVALFNRVKDDSAAFGVRDILWLRPDAKLVSGDRSESVVRNYLNGPFVRVDEISVTISGGTYPRQSGLLLEATTPGCCSRTRL